MPTSHHCYVFASNSLLMSRTLYRVFKKRFRKVLIGSFFMPWIYLLTLRIVLSIILNRKDIRNKNLIFINYKAFGHSVLDSFSVYEFYRQECLIISIGEAHERNATLSRIIPQGCLSHIIIPSWHREFQFSKQILLRKYVGALVVKGLRGAQKMGLLNYRIEIQDDNKHFLNQTAKLYLSKRLGWNRQKTEELSLFLADELNESNATKSLDEGSLIFLAFINRLAEADSIFSQKEILEFKEALWKEVKLPQPTSFNLITLIVSDRGKPWNGIGLEYYVPTINLLLTIPNTIIFCLGDTRGQIGELRRVSKVYNRILSPSEICYDAKLSQFLAIVIANFTVGDGSGVWSIFNLLGKKGIRCNTLPGAKLYNRCISIPRPWKDVSGRLASKTFYSKNLSYDIYPKTINGVKWEPFLMDSNKIAGTIYQLVISDELWHLSPTEIFADDLLHVRSREQNLSTYYPAHYPFTEI